ncbi:hypothetical protein IAT40_004825 [Kwoniella sp. CBS 6097]
MEVDVPPPDLKEALEAKSVQPNTGETSSSNDQAKSSTSPPIFQSPSPLSAANDGTSSPKQSTQPVPLPSQAQVIDLSDTPSPSPSKSSPMKRDSTSIMHLEDLLQTSRPAPASPASSRPNSALFDTSARDRSGSTASASASASGGMPPGIGRRVSSASSSKGSTSGSGSGSRNRSTSRAGSAGHGRSGARPKSMLGTTITLPEPSNDSSSSLDRDRTDPSVNPNLDNRDKQNRHDSIPEYPQSNIVTEHQIRGDTPTQQAENKVDPDRRELSVPPSQVKGDSETSSFVVADQPEASSSSTPTTTLSSALEKEVIVRDFAYDPSDERYNGKGVISLRESTSSFTGIRWPWKSGGAGERGFRSAAESSSAVDGGGGGGGWGGFGLIGGWRGFGNRAKQAAGQDEEDDDEDDDDDEDYRIGAGGRDSRADERYYSSPAQSDSRSLSDQEEDSQMGDPDNDDFDNPRISGSIHLNEPDSGSGSGSGLGLRYKYKILPLLPESEEPSGHYRASYPFEALSSSEMTLVEGDLLKISGRGNGDPGWVIARKVVLGDGGKVEGVEERVGLVPEGYLERVEVVEQ